MHIPPNRQLAGNSGPALNASPVIVFEVSRNAAHDYGATDAPSLSQPSAIAAKSKKLTLQSPFTSPRKSQAARVEASDRVYPDAVDDDLVAVPQPRRVLAGVLPVANSDS